jgi:hypothetical protein
MTYCRWANYSNFCPRRIRRNGGECLSTNLTRFYGGSFLIVIQRFMYLDLLKTGWAQIVLMVNCLPAMLISVDVCVVTTTKDMDDTCMLASILDESIALSNASNRRPFRQSHLRRSCKSPRRQNMGCRFVLPLPTCLILETSKATSTSITPLPSKTHAS